MDVILRELALLYEDVMLSFPPFELLLPACARMSLLSEASSEASLCLMARGRQGTGGVLGNGSETRRNISIYFLLEKKKKSE